MLRISSLLLLLGLLLATGCKKTDDSTPSSAVPTSVVGNWKVSAFTLNPAWPVVVNGSPERFTDYVLYLKRLNETCLTDVVWTFTATGGLSTNMNTLSTCGAKGPNSTFIVDYLVEPNGSYIETANQVDIRGTDNQTNLKVDKTFGPGNTVNLQWKDPRDISNQEIPTTYTLTLTKQ